MSVIAVRSATELRQILPQSGSVVLSSRVAFTWRGTSSRVQLSQTRNFDGGYENLEGSAVIGDPQVFAATSGELAEGVWFWRVSYATAQSSAVWSFRVRRVKGVKNAGRLFDGWDVNCDGRADILLKGAVALGGDPPVLVTCELGPLAVNNLQPEPGLPEPNWGQLVGIGDVDGDGCEDAIVTATRSTHNMYVNTPVPVPILFRGQPGLTSTWQAASRSAHNLTPVGDLNRDGYADAAECDANDCNVYLGGREGVQEQQPFLTLKGYGTLLGGDFDADGLPDLWAINHASGPASRLAFFSGAAPFSSVPSSSFTIPTALNGMPSTGLIVNGNSAILGFAGGGHPDLFWQATSSSGAIATRWPEAAHAVSPWSSLWQVGSWEFIPFVGPGARGVLVVSRMRTERGSDPSQSFVQYGLTAAGTTRLLGRLTVPGLGPMDGIDSFASVGDMNGDGYDEQLVRVMDDLGGDLSYEFTGSETGFRYKRRL